MNVQIQIWNKIQIRIQAKTIVPDTDPVESKTIKLHGSGTVSFQD